MAFPTALTATLTTYSFGTSLGTPVPDSPPTLAPLFIEAAETLSLYSFGTSLGTPIPDAPPTLNAVLMPLSETLSEYSFDAISSSGGTRPTTGLVYPRRTD